jgi:hypothetical protein
MIIAGVGSNLGEVVSQLPKKLKFGSENVKLNPAEESGDRSNFMFQKTVG